MSENYRLIFRGEVLEGQHPAVVRRRLGEAAGFRPEQLEALFSGRTVVVKREADRATAARLQDLFKQAGARLRVVALEAGDGASAAGADGAAGTDIEVLPVGSDVLREDERQDFVPRELDLSHFSVAEPGSALAPADPTPPRPINAPELDVAEPGADLGPAGPAAPPAVDLAAVNFDVAEPGARLGRERPADPPPPDTSHLQLDG